MSKHIIRTMASKLAGKKLWAKQGTNDFRKGCCIRKNSYFTIAEVYLGLQENLRWSSF